ERGPGEEIVQQGTVGDALFIIGRGQVAVSVLDEDGNERLVSSLSEGDYFGEISFLRRTPRTANVRATAPTELHVLRRIDFESLLERLGKRMSEEMEDTAREQVEDRRAKLAALLG